MYIYIFPTDTSAPAGSIDNDPPISSTPEGNGSSVTSMGTASTKVQDSSKADYEIENVTSINDECKYNGDINPSRV
jgi:hypothetical protein